MCKKPAGAPSLRSGFPAAAKSVSISPSIQRRWTSPQPITNNQRCKLRKTPSLIIGLLAGCLSVAAQVTAIKAGSLIDPDAGTALTGQVILIRAGKIEAVGRGLAIPSGAAIID